MIKINILLSGIIVLFSFSCKNDLKKAKKISEEAFEESIEVSKNVVMYVSEKAILKAKIEAPLMENHLSDPKYLEMTEGIFITFFDERGNKSGTLKGDYAKKMSNENLFYIHDNVESVNAKGEKFYSEELVWDGKQSRFYSDKEVKIVLLGGTIIHGDTFWSNQDFSYYEISRSRGNFSIEK